MTGTLLAVTVFTALAGGIAALIIGLVTVAVHTEERRHTLTGPVPGPMTRAARRLNGVYVRTPDAARSIRRGGLGRTPMPERRIPRENTFPEATSDFPPAG
jgi:hypothetical protein